MGRAIIVVAQFGRGSIRLLITLSARTDDVDRRTIIWVQRMFPRNYSYYFADIKLQQQQQQNQSNGAITKQ